MTGPATAAVTLTRPVLLPVSLEQEPGESFRRQLAALVELSPDPRASFTLDVGTGLVLIALEAEDRPGEQPFRCTSGIDEALEVGVDWAREITPGLAPTAVQDVRAPADLEAQVEQLVAQWPEFNLAWIPRSQVVHGPAWELWVGEETAAEHEGHLETTLPGVLRSALGDH